MEWVQLTLPIVNEPFEERLILSKREAAALKRAADILATIRKRMEEVYGEEDAVEIASTEPWVLAESYLSNAMDNLICEGTTIKLPARS